MLKQSIRHERHILDSTEGMPKGIVILIEQA